MKIVRNVLHYVIPPVFLIVSLVVLVFYIITVLTQTNSNWLVWVNLVMWTVSTVLWAVITVRLIMESIDED